MTINVVDLNTFTIDVTPDDESIIDLHKISLEVRLTDYPDRTLTILFDVTITCPT